MKKYLFVIIIALGGFFLSSCDGERLTVSSQPSPPYYERPISPGVGYIWIDGDWVFSGGRYNWHEGHWGRPRSGRTWHTGSWQHRGTGYRWQRGHW